ncbi:Methyltransferase-like protein 4 [Rhizophlyctis rosea]|nr:Methyltransferase-like protein 4 [Rhizophlyctis rosea]
MDIYDLFKIPMKRLTIPGSLVATWVTNHPKFRAFVLDKLYPAWGLKCVGVWVWCKVTTKGEWVGPLDSPHRKPYEILLIGRRVPAEETEIVSLPEPEGSSPQDTFPYHRAIVSVPSRYHSRKPYLGDIFDQFIPHDASSSPPKRLELFARNLNPGWTSWGNEVLKFNDRRYFDVVSGVDE